MKQNFINKNEPSENPNLHNGHEYVDLGLPSGLLWATCNIGASSPEEYGDYFAWGETEPKQIYSWETYKFAIKGSNEAFSKYNKTDNITELEVIDDVAHVNWGGNWRMPTTDEFNELCEHCKCTWTNDYKETGIAGRIFKSTTNGNTIFMPAAGSRGGSELYYVDDYGYFWSRSLSPGSGSDAYCLYLDNSNMFSLSYLRYSGHSVRAVCPRAE